MEEKQRFRSINGYMASQSWLWATLIQYFVEELCHRILDQNNDPQRRLYDQITMAARSVPANLAEGYSRRETSKTTQFRLIDVARASISELSSDLFYQSMRLNIPLWNKDHPYFERARTLGIPQPSYGSWWLADSQKFLLGQIDRLRPWLANDSVEFSLNVLLILCERLKLMIEKSLNQLHQEFLLEGGFTEKLSSERLEAKSDQAQDSPRCPICNGPMQRKVARKGGNHGNPFWSCCQYPRCTGTRPWSYN
ncbi:MAG: four helix bundle protein [Bacteroidales bacterium]|nr:four helix bundle protein [Bacteroidales bacterium]MCD8394471.1 four helix bundle protein [Bacteroidales bacterium]